MVRDIYCLQGSVEVKLKYTGFKSSSILAKIIAINIHKIRNSVSYRNYLNPLYWFHLVRPTFVYT